MKRNIILFLCAFLATLGVCAGVFMLLKYRANLEERYNDLRAQNEELAITAAFAEEYKRLLTMYESIDEEIS
ncbi:MAG: hypothetical protein IJY72_07515, partial [Akkermansia sp.]|nr:hypothetical protein [Akkermansia sp.]